MKRNAFPKSEEEGEAEEWKRIAVASAPVGLTQADAAPTVEVFQCFSAKWFDSVVVSQVSEINPPNMAMNES